MKDIVLIKVSENFWREYFFPLNLSQNVCQLVGFSTGSRNDAFHERELQRQRKSSESSEIIHFIFRTILCLKKRPTLDLL